MPRRGEFEGRHPPPLLLLLLRDEGYGTRSSTPTMAPIRHRQAGGGGGFFASARRIRSSDTPRGIRFPGSPPRGVPCLRQPPLPARSSTPLPARSSTPLPARSSTPTIAPIRHAASAPPPPPPPSVPAERDGRAPLGGRRLREPLSPPTRHPSLIAPLVRPPCLASRKLGGGKQGGRGWVPDEPAMKGGAERAMREKTYKGGP